MDLLVEAELKQALSRPGCPLCRVGEQSVERYLRGVLHEGAMDAATVARLERARGFCRRHAWQFLGLQWQAMHGWLGTATITEGLAEGAEQLLGAYLETTASRSERRGVARGALDGLARALGPTEPCPACPTSRPGTRRTPSRCYCAPSEHQTGAGASRRPTACACRMCGTP
jgi:hypothetical protein